MKKVFSTIAVITMLITASSCKKKMDHDTKIINIEAKIAAGTTYTLNLKQYADADDIATIATQATGNYATSEITNITTTFNPIYTYTPNIKAAGSDKVVLQIKENHPRRDCNKDDIEAVITINFTIN